MSQDLILRLDGQDRLHWSIIDRAGQVPSSDVPRYPGTTGRYKAHMIFREKASPTPLQEREAETQIC